MPIFETSRMFVDYNVQSILPKLVSRYSVPSRHRPFPWIEIYGALVASVSFFCGGVVQSYTSSAIYSLESDGDSNITLTRSDISWIASSPSLAAGLGTLLSAPLMEMCGRHKSLVLLSIPYLFGWILIGFSPNVLSIHVGRAFTGLSIGLSKAVTPIYVSECSRASIRGSLGFLPSMMNALGVLIGLLVGCWISWRKVALIMSVVPGLLLLLTLTLPESPFWLLSQKQEEKAFYNLLRLRGGPGQELRVQEELDEMRSSLREEMNSSSQLKWTDCFWRKENWMAFTLIVFQQLCGVSAVVYYLQMILTETTSKVAGSRSVNPDAAAFCVGMAHLAAFCISIPLIDRVGRRWLLIVSGILMTLAHSTLSLFMFFTFQRDLQFLQITASWLPLSALSLFIAAFSIGFGPVPFVFMTEVFSLKRRSYLCSIATLIAQLVSFSVLQMFPILLHNFPPFLVFLMYAAVCFLASIFVIIAIPETKGMSLVEIEAYFRGQSPSIPLYDRTSRNDNSLNQLSLPYLVAPFTQPIPMISKVYLQ